MQEFGPFDGLLLVDKPAGPTSHDIIDGIRWQFGLKKVGHCGTLDPAATGLLLVVVGKATRLSERLLSDDKVYEGIIKMGEVTDSYDAAGEVVESHEVPVDLSLEQLQEAGREFLGDIMQEPPMVSAVKKEGVPLYKLARKGVKVERKARLVHVYEFPLLHFQSPRVWFRVRCTKGGYVRSLAHELGARIGCGAHLERLHRTQSGSFKCDDAIRFEELLGLDRDGLAQRIIPIRELARILGPMFSGAKN